VLRFTGKEIVEDPYLVASEFSAAVDGTTTRKDVYESVQDYLVNMPKGK
jgi:hypothetical protein